LGKDADWSEAGLRDQLVLARTDGTVERARRRYSTQRSDQVAIEQMIALKLRAQSVSS